MSDDEQGLLLLISLKKVLQKYKIFEYRLHLHNFVI